MSVTAGTRIRAFEVVAVLGAGWARSTAAATHAWGRDVAIKILPHVFTNEPDRLARFEREARMLATLNHPHIGAITVSRRPVACAQSRDYEIAEDPAKERMRYE